MAIVQFPPVESADEYGLLAIGGDLEVSSLVLAYRSGVFPWPMPGIDELTWFAPPRRAVLFFNKFHVSRSLQKTLASSHFETRINTNTAEVIKRCAFSKRSESGNSTWITNDMIQSYQRLALAGFCHSVETYHRNRLVGGLYGVAINRMFAGESMFFLEPNASKVALVRLVEHLRERGCGWLDCQQLTPLFEQFGAEEIDRTEFMELLKEALSDRVTLFP